MTRPDLDAAAYVTALFRLALGREPDGGGLAHWTGMLAAGGDPTAVLAAIQASDEYRRRHPPEAPRASPALIAGLAVAFGAAPLTIIDVGAQILAAEAHVYEPLRRRDLPHHVIGFEPLSERRAERVTTEAGGALEMLPYAIGDGGPHVLHINNDDATSSLFPLNPALNRAFNHLHTLHTLRTERVETHRLDEVLPPGPIDFLKLDIQGAELMALKGAEACLTRTALVHCEVEFAPIYAGQPLFHEVAAYLAARGFILIDLLEQARYSYQPESRRASMDRLIWADALFFREDADDRMLAAQALAALLVYRKPSLAEHLVARLDARTGGRLAEIFTDGPA
ncbi:FkbM family methyltransferase [Humitalea rosea]|uniref:FkbM family methyltransferase n=1 Tax=Humitalea rosea TaxID=990373 RepID=A0A2W7I3M1_9PROT|nr:FkbM family methyltransferase [Humitalea rosea]PZW39835.1 FkbM family methyltransferase [Humitalea rosea]